MINFENDIDHPYQFGVGFYDIFPNKHFDLRGFVWTLRSRKASKLANFENNFDDYNLLRLEF